MSWVAAAIVGGAVIGGVASNKASKTQAGATDRATEEQQNQYEQTRQDQMPWMDAGKQALGKLSGGIDAGQPVFSFNASKVQMDPGYQFGLKQGQQAIDRKTAAAGGRISGAALKEAAQYGNDYATTKYGDAYNRSYGAATDTYNRANQARSDRLNRLAALAGLGQTSTQQVGNNGLYTANGIANNITSQGNARAAGQIAQGNIWAGAGNQIASLYGRNPSAFNSGGVGPVNMGTATGGDMDLFY